MPPRFSPCAGAKAQLDPGLALFIDAGPRVLEALHCTRTNARLLAGLSAHADLGLAAGETSFNAAAGERYCEEAEQWFMSELLCAGCSALS